jgi:hypothetical protein
MTNAMIGDYRIPVAQGLRIFWAAGVQAALGLQGKKSVGDALFTGTSFAVNELLPMNVMGVLEYNKESKSVEFDEKGLIQLAPSVVKPMFEVLANTTFTGGKVHPEAFTDAQKKTVPQAFLGRKDVNPLLQNFSNKMLELGGGNTEIKSLNTAEGKKVSGWFDINPSSIEHLLKGYAGGAGTFLTDVYHTAANVAEGKKIDPSTVPVLNRTYKPYNSEKTLWRKYYEVKNHYDNYKDYTTQAKKTDLTKYNEKYKSLANSSNAKLKTIKTQMENGTINEKEAILQLNALIKQWEEK